MAAISTWSTTAASNNQAAPDGAPEGWLPATVNAWARETMASVRTWYEDSEWVDFGHTLTFIGGTQFSTASGDGDTTAIYHVNRRIKAETTAGTIYGRVTASSHSTVTTVTAAWDSGALDSGLSAASVGAVSADNLSIDAAAVDRLAAVAGIASGTLQLFQQTAAPTGWTKQVTHNDKALRLVTGSVSTGGASAFTAVFGSGKSTANHTLSTSQIPAHTHTSPWVTGGPVEDGGGSAASIPQAGTGPASGSAGGGGGHSHTLTMDLQYVDLIIASKD